MATRKMRRPDYPAALVAELATILETSAENAVRRAELMRLTPVCERCGGCGSYSFNQTDGSRCYGCAGAGHVIARASDMPGVLELARSAVAAGELARYLDRIEAANVAKRGNARVMDAYSSSAALQCWNGWASHAYRTEEMPGNAVAVRDATRAMHLALETARKAVSAWQYPRKGTTPAERQEFAVAARAAIETALERISLLDVAPTAELVAYVRERQAASFEASKRGPRPPRADEAAPFYSGPVASELEA